MNRIYDYYETVGGEKVTSVSDISNSEGNDDQYLNDEGGEGRRESSDSSQRKRKLDEIQLHNNDRIMGDVEEGLMDTYILDWDERDVFLYPSPEDFQFPSPQIWERLSQTLEKLSLHSCPHRTIPNDLGMSLRMLKELALDHCDGIEVLPSSIGLLKNLEILIINSTSVETLPAEIGELYQLKLLHLDNNEHLATIPTEISQCHSLQIFELLNHHFPTLPESIFSVVSLTEIHLEFCEELHEIPVTIGELTNLRRLLIRYCHTLQTLPNEIGQLINLKELRIDASEISFLPKSLEHLINLEQLTIHSSAFAKPPYGIDKLIKLRSLDLLCEQVGVTDEDTIQQPNLSNLTQLRDLEINTKKFLGLPSSLLRQLKRFHLTTDDTNVIPNLFEESWTTTSATATMSQNRLEELDLHICGSSSNFIRLLHNLRPLASLREFSICKCSIDNYETFLSEDFPKSLRSLSFTNCSHLNQEVDRAFLVRLLEKYPQLGSITGSVGTALCSTYMTYLLCFNSCGRVLLLNNNTKHQAGGDGKGEGCSTGAKESPDDSKATSTLSLSVWATVLARVRMVSARICRHHLGSRVKLQQEIEASTIYGLLHGRALLCRSEAPDNCQLINKITHQDQM